MELNRKVEKTLTREQKVKFQRDNGKFKLLNNIVILPVITVLLGIYLESIIIVSISIVCIIAFLICKIFSFSRKNIIFEEVIIPTVLKEKFENVSYIDDSISVDEDFKKSKIIPTYDKIDVNKSYVIRKEKYIINLSTIIVNKLNIEESDGVVDKELEEKFNGIFISVKLPVKSTTNFIVLDKNLKIDDSSKVKITNYEFDKVYNVYSDKQVEVRGILSAGIMARILEFNSKANNIISFSICEDMLYIAVQDSDFLKFNGKGRLYVDEEKAKRDLELLEILDMFVTYFINMFEK